jgi:glycosyltransferase involved in cell wall biosynthesis
VKHVSDQELRRHYYESWFSVFPSELEGFGLPIQESLQHGTPCLCASWGAMGEVALGGGCVTCDVTSTDSLAVHMEKLVLEEDLRRRLSRQAAQRTWLSWDDYTRRLCASIRAWFWFWVPFLPI